MSHPIDIDRCPACAEPTHASETDDTGLCTDCRLPRWAKRNPAAWAAAVNLARTPPGGWGETEQAVRRYIAAECPACPTAPRSAVAAVGRVLGESALHPDRRNR